MRKTRTFVRCAMLVAGATPCFAEVAAPQFTSRVYFVIHESSPGLVARGRRVIEKEFAETFAGVPQFQGRNYQVVSDGNQVIFSMVSDADTRAPFQSVVSGIVGQLNGRVRTRGGYDVLKTAYDESAERYLEVTLDDTNTKIRSITARAITLRDLLAELKLQFGDSPVAAPVPTLPRTGLRVPKAPVPQRFSYMIDRECAARQLDWNFGSRPGESEGEVQAKTLDEAMQELAKFFKLTVENHQGTYMFSGDCPRLPMRQQRAAALELLPSSWIPMADFSAPPSLPAPRQNPPPMPAPIQVRMVE